MVETGIPEARWIERRAMLESTGFSWETEPQWIRQTPVKEDSHHQPPSSTCMCTYVHFHTWDYAYTHIHTVTYTWERKTRIPPPSNYQFIFLQGRPPLWGKVQVCLYSCLPSSLWITYKIPTKLDLFVTKGFQDPENRKFPFHWNSCIPNSLLLHQFQWEGFLH